MKVGSLKKHMRDARRAVAATTAAAAALVLLQNVFLAPRHAAYPPAPPVCELRGTFDLSKTIDISEEVDASALRWLARRRAVRMARGWELLMIATNTKGCALALNALLNFDALGYRHHFVLGHDKETCSSLGAAARRMRRSSSYTARLMDTPCAHDSAWDAWSARTDKHLLVQVRWAMQLQRWRIFARLVRLGYNVLNMDEDAVALEDPYPHLHSRALAGRFTLMYAAETRNAYSIEQAALQNGIVYACGTRRDGAGAWVLAEVVDRMLRVVDACEGSLGEAAGTMCSPRSWIRVARLDDDFLFDQAVHDDVIMSSHLQNGGHWWRLLGRMVAEFWPSHLVRPTYKSREVHPLVRSFRAEQSRFPFSNETAGGARLGPLPCLGSAVGAELSEATGGRLFHWIRSPLTDVDSVLDGDISGRWSMRFRLANGSRSRDVKWAPISAAVRLADRSEATSVIEEAFVQLVMGRGIVNVSNPRRRALVNMVRAARPSELAIPSGVLPSRRGQLSRAWQRTLQADLAASGCEAAEDGEQRRAVPLARDAARDGEHGSSWAPTPAGDEATALLPGWLVCHWTVAKLGLGGSPLPMTVILHVTNAYDKMLALAAHGYLSYAALHGEVMLSVPGQSIRDPSVEKRIWAGGARPPAIGFARSLLPRHSDALQTIDVEEYLQTVVEPLFIAAIATGRLPLLPSVPCSTPWLQSSDSPRHMRQRPLDPNSMQWGDCRTGVCSFRAYAVGSVSSREARLAGAGAHLFGYTSTFGEHTERLARDALQCVPLAGMIRAMHNPLSGRRCKMGSGGYLLQGPVSDAYIDLLGTEAEPSHNQVTNLLPGSSTVMNQTFLSGALSAAAPPVEVEYTEFVQAVQAASMPDPESNRVFYLPARLRVRNIPSKVQAKVGDYCRFGHEYTPPESVWSTSTIVS